jgi:hypothetical protein
MAAETVLHARIKRRIDHALGAALAQGGHDCEVFVSGPKVQIDAASAFEPDVVVSCAEVPDGLLVPEPLLVVEVLSPSTRDKDFTVKLAGSSCTTTARPASRSSAQGSPAAAPCASTRRGWTSTSTRSTPTAARDAWSSPAFGRWPAITFS